MAKNKVSEWSTTASNNTDIAGINIAEGCAPSGINNAIREVMAQIKDMQTGADSDGLVVGGTFTASGAVVLSGSVTATISAPLIMSGTVSMNGTNNIGNTTSSTILSGTVTQTSSSKLYLDSAVTSASTPPLSWSGDTNTGIYHPAADTMALVTNGSDRLTINPSGVVIIGTGEATTSVTGNILRSPSGSGTNISGSNFEIQAGNGTGTGGSGNIVFKTAPTRASGSTANTLAQRLAITKNGGFSFGSTSTAYGLTGQSLISNGDAPPSFDSSVRSSVIISATGESVLSFTDVPNWVKRITVMFNGISFGTADQILVKIGTGGVVDSTNYVSAGSRIQTTVSSTGSTAGFIIYTAGVSEAINGSMVINLFDSSTNTWVSSGSYASSVSTTYLNYISGGTKSLSGVLDIVSVTRAGGSAIFDAGSISLLFE